MSLLPIRAQTPQNYYRRGPFSAGISISNNIKYVNDFGISLASRNVTLSVTVRLIPNPPNPFFVYGDGQVGTYTYNDGNLYNIFPYRGYTLNVVQPAAIPLDSFWKGDAEYYAPAAFWDFTSDFKVTASGAPSEDNCALYKRAWLNTTWYSPVYWDSSLPVDEQRLISPEGVYWHNDDGWDQGWKSTLTITNNTGATREYEISYGSKVHSSQCSLTYDNNMIYAYRTLTNGQTISETIYSLFGFSTLNRYRTEGAITVKQVRPSGTPPAAGTLVSHYISMNGGSYTHPCGVKACPLSP